MWLAFGPSRVVPTMRSTFGTIASKSQTIKLEACFIISRGARLLNRLCLAHRLFGLVRGGSRELPGGPRGFPKSRRAALGGRPGSPGAGTGPQNLNIHTCCGALLSGRVSASRPDLPPGSPGRGQVGFALGSSPRRHCNRDLREHRGRPSFVFC